MSVDEIRRIKIHYNDSIYSVFIQNEKEEEYYRKAGVLIDNLLNDYRNRFPGRSPKEYSDMILLKLAENLLEEKDRNDTEPYQKSMQKLIGEIEDIFKNE